MKTYRQFRTEINESVQQLDEIGLVSRGLVHLRKAMRGEKGAIPQPIAKAVRVAGMLGRAASGAGEVFGVPVLGHLRRTTALRFGGKDDMETRERQLAVRSRDRWFFKGTGDKAVGSSPAVFDPNDDRDHKNNRHRGFSRGPLALGRWKDQTKGRNETGDGVNMGRGRIRDTSDMYRELTPEEKKSELRALADMERAQQGHAKLERARLARGAVERTNGNGWKATFKDEVRYFPTEDEATEWLERKLFDRRYGIPETRRASGLILPFGYKGD